MKYSDGGKTLEKFSSIPTEIVGIETSKVTQLPRIVNSKQRVNPAFMDVNFLAYAQKIDLKMLSIKTNQRRGMAGYFFVEEHLLIKATGVCGLLNAYPGTQSGKLLGGKLANKENQFFHNVLGKTLKTRENHSDTTLFYKQYIFQNALFHRHPIQKSKLEIN